MRGEVGTDDQQDFEARDGDVLVVSYPEVKVPLATKYSTVTVGGLIYTRQLRKQDNLLTEYERVYAFLKRMAEADAREKVKLWTEELAGKSRRLPLQVTEPKPVVTSRSQLPATGARPKPVSR